MSSSSPTNQAIIDEATRAKNDAISVGHTKYAYPVLLTSSGCTRQQPTHASYGTIRPLEIRKPAEEASTKASLRSWIADRDPWRYDHVTATRHRAQSLTQGSAAPIHRPFSDNKLLPKDKEEERNTFHPPIETSPLLAGVNDSADGTDVDASFERDVEEGGDGSKVSGCRRTTTTWLLETKIITSDSAPLIATFLLQYSINVASIFAAGRIGRVELGAVSLANMSLTITCIAPIQGLATSLDTLCAQAYGNGRYHLVGLQCQRMTIILLCLSVPVAVLWMFSEQIFASIIADAEAARLTALYLKVMIFAIPGTIIFETGKRLLQAQGLFKATTSILLVAAPVNIFISWFLVWKVGLGFVGAPIAVAVTRNLMPILLILYVRFVNGSRCWGGLSKRAFTNWGIMSRLALPSMIMIEAELLAFEIMTLLSSQFGTEYLAAHSVLITFSIISFQMPFAVSVAASTRVATLIGAGLVDAAKTAALMAFAATCTISLLNLTIYVALRFHLPLLFTSDQKVIALIAQAIPFAAAAQLFDGLSTGAHGLLRGIGKQSIGGPANIVAYYLISLPISLALAFQLDWKMEGLWAGITVGLVTVSLIEYTYLLKTDWHKAALEAEARNAAG